MNKIAWEFKFSIPDSCEKLSREALAIAQKENYTLASSAALNNIGVINMYRGDFDSALVYFHDALNLRKNDKNFLARSYLNIGTVYQKKGDFKNGLSNYLLASKLREELKDTIGIALVHNIIGELYFLQQNTSKAREEFESAYEMAKGTKDKRAISDCMNNLGIIYQNNGQFEKALDYFIKACDIRKELGLKSAVARTLNNIGSTYYNMKKNDLAIQYISEAMNYFQLVNDRESIEICFNNIGEMYAGKGDYKNAADNYNKSLELSKAIGSKAGIMNAYESLSSLFALKNDYKKAFEYHRLFSSAKDSMLGEENSKQINEMQTKYETEKKIAQITSLEKDKKLGRLDLEKKESDIKKQNIIIACAGIALVLFIVLAFLIYRSYRQKKLSNEKLSSAYVIIEEKNLVVEEKNKEILDSIHYAKRIQQALFASENLLKKNLPEFFILYKPKDIVSGDFYWAQQVLTKNNENRFLLCVGDCTGHGVPGAFMSLLGISFLNQITMEKKITHPNLAFNVLREEIGKALNPDVDQKEIKGNVQDGMDAVLCSFDMEKMNIEFACANNPLWMIRAAGSALEEFSPDKSPLGKFHGETKSFRLQSAQLNKGDTLFLFTDGYADQFGGPSGKKFKYKQLEELLLSMKEKSLAEQKNILNDKIEKWRGPLEQIDDILIIGVRV